MSEQWRRDLTPHWEDIVPWCDSYVQEQEQGLADYLSTDYGDATFESVLVAVEAATDEGVASLPEAVSLVTGAVAGELPTIEATRGTLEPRKAADVLLVERDSIPTVTHVLIDGTPVVEDKSAFRWNMVLAYHLYFGSEKLMDKRSRIFRRGGSTVVHGKTRDGKGRRTSGGLKTVSTGKAAKRLMTVLAYKDGVAVATLSERYAIQQSTVYFWLDRFEEMPIDEAIKDGDRPGRPPELSTEERDELRTDLNRSPQAFGFADASWTTEIVRDHVAEKYGVEYSYGHIRRLLRSLTDGSANS